MKHFIQKHTEVFGIRLGFYQEPIRIGLSAVIDLGDNDWNESWLITVKFIIWTIDIQGTNKNSSIRLP